MTQAAETKSFAAFVWGFFASIRMTITVLLFLALGYASLSPDISDRIQPLMPALKSNWLIAHVIACFIGYAAFAYVTGLSLMVLV